MVSEGKAGGVRSTMIAARKTAEVAPSASVCATLDRNPSPARSEIVPSGA